MVLQSKSVKLAESCQSINQPTLGCEHRSRSTTASWTKPLSVPEGSSSGHYGTVLVACHRSSHLYSHQSLIFEGTEVVHVSITRILTSPYTRMTSFRATSSMPSTGFPAATVPPQCVAICDVACLAPSFRDPSDRCTTCLLYTSPSPRD